MQYSAPAKAGETLTFSVAALPQAFAQIPDPRRAQGTRYALAAVLSLAVAAILANQHAVLAIAAWGACQSTAIRHALGFERESMPHQTAIQRAFWQIEPTDFAAALRSVFEPVVPGAVRARGSQGVALDGNAQRGRLRHATTPIHPVHAVTAFCHDLGGVLTQRVVDVQQHEAA